MFSDTAPARRSRVPRAHGPVGGLWELTAQNYPRGWVKESVSHVEKQTHRVTVCRWLKLRIVQKRESSEDFKEVAAFATPLEEENKTKNLCLGTLSGPPRQAISAFICLKLLNMCVLLSCNALVNAGALIYKRKLGVRTRHCLYSPAVTFQWD